MGKNQSASGLTNVIQYSNGNITFVSGSTTLMSISSSGAITTTGVISGSNALSASYAANADTLDGLDSTVFTLTSSFNAFSSSILAQTASLNSFSASILATTASLNLFSSSVLTFTGSAATRLGALEAATASLYTATSSLNAFSASILTFTGSAATRLGALEAATSSLYSYTSSLNNKTSSFATTGSNVFIGTQTITGSVLQSGSFTSTGTLTAQTLVVQTITSSVVYSSGSNIFGNTIGNTQTFTGSVLVTGSLTISTGGNASAPIIFGSTIACSPIGCFATSCATSFIGGTFSGTTGTFVCGVISGTPANSSSLLLENFNGDQTSTTLKLKSGRSDVFYHMQAFSGNTTEVFRIEASGKVVSASTISGTTIYGSTAVCSPIGLFSGCVGIGTASPSSLLHAYVNAAATVTVAKFTAANYGCPSNKTYIQIGTQYQDGSSRIGSSNPSGNLSELFFETAIASSGDFTERMRITSGGNVGIGTSTTYSTLTVGSSDGTAVISPGGNNTHLTLASVGASGAIRFYTIGGGTGVLATTESMRVAVGGNVGIGATSPAALLHICTTTSADNIGHIQYENACTGTGAAANAQLIGKSKYGTAQFMVWENYGIRFGMRSITNGGAGDIYFTTCNDAVQLRITNTGVACFTGTVCMSSTAIITGGGNTLTLRKGTGSPALAFGGISDEAAFLVEGISGGGIKWYTSPVGCTLSNAAWNAKFNMDVNGISTFSCRICAPTATITTLSSTTAGIGNFSYTSNYSATSGCFAVICAYYGAIIYMNSMHNNGTATYQYIYSNGPTGGASLTLVSATSAYGPACTTLALCGNGWVYAFQPYGGATYWSVMAFAGNYTWAF